MQSQDTTTTFFLPDVLAAWPWPRRINPHYEEVKAASAAWLESFHPFSARAQEAFNLHDFNLLASLAYPFASKGQVRAACDLMNTFFVFDEFSDIEDKKTVQMMADVIMDALRNPTTPRPAGEFWAHAREFASSSAQDHFIIAFDLYCQSVVRQAADRDEHHIHEIDKYFELRRENIGCQPSFVILEFDMDLPAEVFTHPTIIELTTCAIDLIILGNDMCSYNVEQAHGNDGYNIVTVLRNQFGTDVEGAMEWIAEHCRNIVERFLKLYAQGLPSWTPEIDAQVKRYVDGIGNWVRASDSWSFEGSRYFGSKGVKIQQDRWVTLMPRKEASSPLS